MRQVKYFLIILALIFAFYTLLAQDSSQVAAESTIKVYAEIEFKQVPLNRKVTFTVRVEWMGDLDRYRISELENPVIENFDIYSTSSADRRLTEGGVAKAAKIYEFILTPRALGMGYVEGVVVKYIDTSTGEGRYLTTNRLDIKVIEPVPEPTSFDWQDALYLIIGLFILLLAVGIFLWKRKSKREKLTEVVEVVPLEEEFLTTLRETVNLKATDVDIKNGFASISKILRKYLMQKYQVSAMEQTSAQLLSALQEKQLNETIYKQVDEILRLCDLAKFAGSMGDQKDLFRVYTLMETILEKNLTEGSAEAKLEKAAEEK